MEGNILKDDVCLKLKITNRTEETHVLNAVVVLLELCKKNGFSDISNIMTWIEIKIINKEVIYDGE